MRTFGTKLDGEIMNDYLNLLVWSLGIGICLCNFYIFYNKAVLGRMVRGLIKRQAFAPDNALSLAELGLDKNAFVSGAVKKKSSALYGVIEQIDDKNAYYIPESKKEKADKLFSTKESSLAVAVGSSVLILLVTYLVTLVIPFIISVAQGIF